MRSTRSAIAVIVLVAGAWAVTGRAVDLQLKGPSPDLERMLCHPAFAVPLGAGHGQGDAGTAACRRLKSGERQRRQSNMPSDFRNSSEISR